MPDRYRQLATSSVGSRIIDQLGLPAPVELRRHDPDGPLLHGPILVGGSDGGALLEAVRSVADAAGVPVESERLGPDEQPDTDFGALVFDAGGIGDSRELAPMYRFFRDAIRQLKDSGRLLVLGRPPRDTDDPRAAAAQRALEGFVRSAGKEMRGGSTANLLRFADGGEDWLASTLRFLLSGRSAYVSGQPITVGAPAPEDREEPGDRRHPLDGRVALVTGAARGIGAAMAETLSRDGAHLVCLDLPSMGAELTTVANRVGGSALQLDITAEDAPARIVEHVRERHGALDVLVHNAGITRDRMLAGMDDARWDATIAVNLASQEAINERVLDEDLLPSGGRIVCVSSVAGLAGNRGQTNYAASKAGVVGMVRALAPELAERNATINAVAPGFIETVLTGEIPLVMREVGRRANSLAQGGVPVDVAEVTAWLAQPGTGGVNGEVVRVCGQSILGA